MFSHLLYRTPDSSSPPDARWLYLSLWFHPAWILYNSVDKWYALHRLTMTFAYPAANWNEKCHWSSKKNKMNFDLSRQIQSGFSLNANELIDKIISPLRHSVERENRENIFLLSFCVSSQIMKIQTKQMANLLWLHVDNSATSSLN